MKKLIAIMLAALMLLSFVACGAAGNGDIVPEVEEGTVGHTLWNAFLTEIEANPEISGEELANKIITNPIIQFFGGAMPIEAGAEFFMGFDNYQITGYETATMFGPMMGSIPFIGYIFELAEGADVNAFVEALNTNCNTRWQICVTADQIVVGTKGNTVFFLMCPASFDMPEDDGFLAE